MPPRPSRATILYRSTRMVPGANPPLGGGCKPGGVGGGATAVLSGSGVGVSTMAMARPHEEQKRTLSEDTAPHPEQLTIGRIVSHRAARQGSLMCGIRSCKYRFVRSIGEQSANRKLPPRN